MEITAEQLPFEVFNALATNTPTLISIPDSPQALASMLGLFCDLPDAIVIANGPSPFDPKLLGHTPVLPLTALGLVSAYLPKAVLFLSTVPPEYDTTASALCLAGAVVVRMV